MPWLLLIIAGLCEVGFAIGLKYSEGFTKPVPALFASASMCVSLWLLILASRQISIGTAYAVWTGIGAVGTVLFGMFLLGEPRHAARIVSILLIGAGIVGLKLFSGNQTENVPVPASSEVKAGKPIKSA
jgi:quaternary ammonium compound-resistance protein SugE